MVKAKKIIPIILIVSLSLSLVSGFSYNKSREILAAGTCPAGCEAIEKDGQTYCINCPIPCQIGTGTFANKSCLPASGDLEEWACGREIPVGEVVERSSFLASRMAAEFGGIIESGKELVRATEELLNGNPERPPLPQWNCLNTCGSEPGCYKYLNLTWQLVAGPADQCAAGPQPPGQSVCGSEPCPACPAGFGDWETTFPPDPEMPEDTITCQYQLSNCSEDCTLFRCSGIRGGNPFDSVDRNYSDIELAQEDLRKDIEEDYPVEIKEKLKFKRSYILEQLDFSRCGLAQCWIPAEDYPAILAGEKVGRHLFTGKTVSDMGLFEDDQLLCLITQITNEWEEVQELWESPKNWWSWPVVIFKIAGKLITMGWNVVWIMIKEWFDVGKEEGAYPTNYYCCVM